MQFLKDSASVIRESSKRKQAFEATFGEQEVVMQLHSICPTRWCVRATSAVRALSVYPNLLTTLNELATDKNVRADARARISGLAKRAQNRKTYFGVVFCAELFAPCEDLAKLLQGKDVTAHGAIEAATSLITRLTEKRFDQSVNALISRSTARCDDLDLKALKPRPSKTPQRYRHTEKPSETLEPASVEEWRRQYIETVDILVQELKVRFQQADMAVAAKREQLFLSAVTGIHVSEAQVEELALPAGFDLHRLQRHLNSVGELGLRDVRSAVELGLRLSNLTREARQLLSEAEKLLKLVLSLPISVACSERSFSSLRRLKTWIRSRMTQQRLTHSAVLTIHWELLDNLDVMDVMREFVAKTLERKSVFGKVDD